MRNYFISAVIVFAFIVSANTAPAKQRSPLVKHGLHTKVAHKLYKKAPRQVRLCVSGQCEWVNAVATILELNEKTADLVLKSLPPDIFALPNDSAPAQK